MPCGSQRWAGETARGRHAPLTGPSSCGLFFPPSWGVVVVFGGGGCRAAGWWCGGEGKWADSGRHLHSTYTYVTRDLADTGCHSAAGRVARLVERAPSCAHGGGGCWVRVPAHLFCARGRRSRTDSSAEGPCVSARDFLANPSLSLSLSVLEQTEPDRPQSVPSQTQHIPAQHRNRAPSEQGSAVPDATVASPPPSNCPSAICHLPARTHDPWPPTPPTASTSRSCRACSGFVLPAPPRPAPTPCVLSALTPGPGPGVTPGHAGCRLPAAADPTHTGQTPTPAGHAGHAQPRPRRGLKSSLLKQPAGFRGGPRRHAGRRLCRRGL